MRPNQSWCSLCYAHVGEAFDPLTAPLHEVLGQVEAGFQFDEPVNEPVERTDVAPLELGIDPTTTLTQTEGYSVDAAMGDDAEEPVEVSDIDVMLSMLAAEHKAMDPAAGFTDRLGDRTTRVAIMVGGTVIIGAFLFAMLTVFGAIF